MCIFSKKSISTNTLYKYYGCKDEDKARIEPRILGELYFSSPLLFNDPYDCQLPIIKNNTEFHSKGASHIKYILEEEGFPAEDTYRKLLNKEKTIEQQVFSEQINRLGILCLTKRYDNILMWAHYTENVGMCLEYDVSLVEANLRHAIAPNIRAQYGSIAYKHFLDKNRITLGNVTYDTSLSESSSNLFLESFEECKQKYWHKLKDWEYEQEYRIGVSLGGNIAVKIPNIVKHIYMGCNSTMLQIAEMCQIIEKNKLNIPISIMKKEPIGLVPKVLSKDILDAIVKRCNNISTPFGNFNETI